VQWILEGSEHGTWAQRGTEVHQVTVKNRDFAMTNGDLDMQSGDFLAAKVGRLSMTNWELMANMGMQTWLQIM